MQRNKYSDVNITEHKHDHHDEMKTSTEYRKRKHMITKDEDKQTGEIEKVFSQSLQTQIRTSTQHSYEEMKELRK